VQNGDFFSFSLILFLQALGILIQKGDLGFVMFVMIHNNTIINFAIFI